MQQTRPCSRRRNLIGRFRVAVVQLLMVTMFISTGRAELTAGDLLLVVNRNMPESIELARTYASLRKVPEGRVVELDLPSAEQMSFEAYERDVVPPIREFLRKNKLDQQVKCLVTFYGVPLRVAARVNTPDDAAELKTIEFDKHDAITRATQAVVELEKLAASKLPAFKPEPGQTLERLGARADAALRAVQSAGANEADLAKRAQLDDALRGILVKLVGAAQLPYKPAPGESTMPADVNRAVEQRKVENSVLLRELTELAERRFERDARVKQREIVKSKLGLFAWAQVLSAHSDYLQTTRAASPVPQTTSAALDNELALLRINAYPRLGGQVNPFHYSVPSGQRSPVLMVMRLDAGSPQVVRKMMTDTIEAEQTGLTGRFAIDARGALRSALKPESPPIVAYDQLTRDLAALVQSKTDVPVTLDDEPGLIPENSLKDIALYTGWYSVRRYVAPGTFARGAVGFHTASFELVSLRTVDEQGWVRGLGDDGVVAGVGPVAEPFLHAFPRPDDFFPLLMTGKLTLAEVYWATTPMTSWMMIGIGDPLYKPFGVKPALKPDDLPDRLKPALMR